VSAVQGDGLRRLRVYALVVLGVAAAFGIRLVLRPVVGPLQPYALFYVVVIVAVWYAGPLPALVATALGLVGGTWLVVHGAPGGLPPPGTITPVALLYAVTSLGLIVVTAGLRRRERTARAETAVARDVHRTLERELARREEAEDALHRHIAALEQLREAYREQEERLRLMVESAHDYAIIGLDPDGTIASWSEGARRTYGLGPTEVLGQHVRILFTPDDQASGVPEAEMATAAETGQADDDRWHVRAGGARFYAGGSTRPIHDARGALRGFVKVVRDVTDRLRAAEEHEALLRQAEDARREAEAANRAKDDFLAVLSHELRAPLHATVGWLYVLRRARDDVARARAIETIERNVAAQARVIDDLLDVSRIIAGKLHVELAPVDLAPIVASAVESARPAAEAKGLVLAIASPLGACPVRGDAKRLAQVFDNLLANAIKFTPAGGRVDVAMEEGADAVAVRVADTGEGLEAHVLPIVFEAFRQGDASAERAHGGLGLGLSIVRHLMQLHGGTVTAASAGRGHGAVFTVRLPLHAAHLPARPVRSPGVVIPHSLEGVAVLVVDDDADARDALAFVLEAAGARVRVAGSVGEALEALRAAPVSVVVSDVAMPGGTGYDLVRALRELDAAAGRWTRSIAISGLAARDDRLRAAAAGFDRHVAKPVPPEELIRVVSALLTEERRAAPG
jgi:PAS domain S-box-containing protein